MECHQYRNLSPSKTQISRFRIITAAFKMYSTIIHYNLQLYYIMILSTYLSNFFIHFITDCKQSFRIIEHAHKIKLVIYNIYICKVNDKK